MGKNLNWFMRFSKAVVKVYLILFQAFETEKVGEIPQEGGVLICGNHVSNTDSMFISVNSERLVYWTAKASLFKFKPFGWMISKYGAFPVNPRGSGDVKQNASSNTLEKAMQIVNDGNALGLFPEGHRMKTSKRVGYNVRSGAGVIAIETGCKVVPVGIIGGETLFKKAKIIIGEPFTVEKQEGKLYTYDEYVEVSKYILKKCYELINQIPPFEVEEKEN